MKPGETIGCETVTYYDTDAYTNLVRQRAGERVQWAILGQFNDLNHGMRELVTAIDRLTWSLSLDRLLLRLTRQRIGKRSR